MNNLQLLKEENRQFLFSFYQYNDVCFVFVFKCICFTYIWQVWLSTILRILLSRFCCTVSWMWSNIKASREVCAQWCVFICLVCPAAAVQQDNFSPLFMSSHPSFFLSGLERHPHNLNKSNPTSRVDTSTMSKVQLLEDSLILLSYENSHV